jgi:hypothetical protein
LGDLFTLGNSGIFFHGTFCPNFDKYKLATSWAIFSQTHPLVILLAVQYLRVERVMFGVNFDGNQSDQIGQIFAQWAIVYFG